MNELREHLLWLLEGGNAHVGFERAVADLAPEMRGQRAAGVPHTPWRIVEHMRLAQWDILEFSRSAEHTSPCWPEGYWPEGDAPPTAEAWDQTIEAFHRDLDELERLVADPAQDLFAELPWGDGQTLLREALLVADHNAYHLGQLVAVRRGLGAWEE